MTIPAFGTFHPNVDYILRPGGYAVLVNECHQVAVVQTPSGVFLPGGGQENGESPEEATNRELMEECGLVVRLGRCLGTADELIDAADGHMRKRCTFFLATVVEKVGPGEPDHQLVWCSAKMAAESLVHHCQQWAVVEAFRPLETGE